MAEPARHPHLLAGWPWRFRAAMILLAAGLASTTGFCSAADSAPHAPPPAPEAVQPADDPVGRALAAYVGKLVAELAKVAEKKPEPATFREAAKPLEALDGFYDASLLSPDFVITQVYRPAHALARGFDLKKVAALKPFVEKMKKTPGPQLSEPAGGFLQPRLVSLRVPVCGPDGKPTAIVSLMLRESALLTAAGLDACRAYRILCDGAAASEKGTLSATPRTVRLALPSTTWVVEYDR